MTIECQQYYCNAILSQNKMPTLLLVTRFYRKTDDDDNIQMCREKGPACALVQSVKNYYLSVTLSKLPKLFST